MVCAMVVAVSITAGIGIVSIRNLGNNDARQMLYLLCETADKNLNAYFDSVEQAVGTVSQIVGEDLDGLSRLSDGRLADHIDRMRAVFEKVAVHTNGVLTYYYRIDPDISEKAKGFWYTRLEGDEFTEHEVTDITKYDTKDTSKLVWFTVPKATGKPVWLPPYITDNLGARVISYNVPVFRKGIFVGVIGIEIDYSLMAQEVDHVTMYDQGYAFINDAEGNLVYHPLIDVAALTEEERAERADVPAGVLSRDRYIRYRYGKDEKLGVWLPLNNGMRLNVVVPVSVIDGRWQHMAWLILAASLPWLVLASIFMMHYAKRLTNPLRELTAATEQVKHGDYRIELQYDGEDEVGILTQAFSNLASNLQEQIHALAESEQANAAKTAFLSNMSHEIRTPITTILGMNEIIARDTGDEAVLEYSENIRKAGTSLLGIISDILDFTKIGAGKLELVPAPYSLPEMIGDLYNMVQFRAEEKGLALCLEIDPSLPAGLVGDVLRIKQVITNLLTNAIKYTETGSVTLAVSLAGRVENPAAEGAGEMATLYIAVSDTGIGIRDEEKDKLFESFERLDTRRNHAIEGVGLGLAICRELLQMMGAGISVQSTYHVGTTFSFYLRQKVSDPSAIGKFDVTPVSRNLERHVGQFDFVAPDSRILLVDDTPMNLEVIAGLLKPTQMQIDLAHSGAECIQKFAVYPYDLVFLDYRMPQMDGMETLAAMKEKLPQKAASTPIISLTASAVQGERERMLHAGFTDYLTKPVSITEMEEMLVKYLPEEEVVFIKNEAQGQVSDPLEGIPPEAFEYPWLDPREGVEYCGDAGMYLKAVEFFAKTIEEKAKQLEDCLAAGDIQLYTVTVHSLKSTSRSIGMASFSERAKELEMAGKNGDVGQLQRDTPGFLKMYRGLKKELEKILGGA